MPPDPVLIPGKSEDGARKWDNETLLTSAHEALEHARQFDTKRLPQAMVTFARLLARDGQYERARIYAQEVLQLEQRTHNAIEAILTLGICATQSNALDEAEQHFSKAADLSRKYGYPLGLARAIQHLTSSVLIVRGQFHLASTMLEETSLLREEHESKHWNESFLRGLIYEIIGDRRQCRQVLDDLVAQIEPGTRLAASYYYLWARLALDEDELEQAKEYLSLGLRIANRLGEPDLVLWISLEYSRYHRLHGEPAAARTWADDALNQARRYGALYFQGIALIERAQSWWNCGDPVEAEKDLDDALCILEPMRAAYDLSRACYLRALWLNTQNRTEAEAAWLEAARSISRSGFAFLLEKEQESAFPLVAAHMRSKTPQVKAATEDLLRHLANVPPPPLRIVTLGQFSVWKGRRRIPDQAWSRRKAGELFRYLLLQPHRAAGREVIIEALWPDHDSDSPSDLLHQATSALRHAMEPDLPDKFPSRYIKVEGEHIALALPHGSTVDFEHFERVLPLAIQTHHSDNLQEALNLYSGELFPSDRYADWSAEKRQSLAELRLRGLVALAQIYVEKGQYYNAITCVRQVLNTDAWNEDAVLLGMQAFAGLQDIPHALQMYVSLESTLRSELDIAPRSDLRTLAETFRKR